METCCHPGQVSENSSFISCNYCYMLYTRCQKFSCLWLFWNASVPNWGKGKLLNSHGSSNDHTMLVLVSYHTISIWSRTNNSFIVTVSVSSSSWLSLYTLKSLCCLCWSRPSSNLTIVSVQGCFWRLYWYVYTSLTLTAMNHGNHISYGISAPPHTSTTSASMICSKLERLEFIQLHEYLYCSSKRMKYCLVAFVCLSVVDSIDVDCVTHGQYTCG